MKTNTNNSARRAIAAVLALAMSFGPLTPAYGAATILTDQPIAAKVAAKPNIIYTLDDSGSMSLNYIPDYVTSTQPINTPPGYCRHTNGTTNLACNTDFAIGYDEPMYASEFNRLYYNPNINYEPPVDGAGNQANAAFPNGACGPGFTTACATVYKMMNAANTVNGGVNWKRVPNDMYLLAPPVLPAAAAANTTDLAAKVNTPVFCNTDWPKAAYAGAAAAAVMWNEVADVNGENPLPNGVRGSDCRINGVGYDAVSGAPAVVDDYNYPWQKSSLLNDPKYFWKTGQSRSIWCKTSGPGWPKTCVAGASTCAGVIATPPSQPQTCIFTGNATGVDNTVFIPAGCGGWAPGIGQPVGGCIGAIGIECLACNFGTKVTGRNGACHLTATGVGGSNAPCSCVGVGCALPACPNYQPPDTCSTGWVPGANVCNPAASATCNTKYGSNPAVVGVPSLLDDSNGAGDTCRHNNYTGAYVTTRFDLPQAGAPAANFYSKLVQDASCGLWPTTVPVPRYYYTVASVSFCNTQKTQVTDPNDQWRGFGKGVCQVKNDQTTYKFVKYGKFTKVGLVNDGRTFAYTDPFTGVAGTRTFAEEMTNFANWFTYYRTRILTAKTTTAIAFNIVDKTYRAGFHTMNLRNGGPPATTAEWLDIKDFESVGPTFHRQAWYAKLFSISIPAGTQTPTLDAMIRIGEVVKLGAGAVTGLPAHADPFPTNPATGNPVSCTNNYHILFTDGETNQAAMPTTFVPGEVDGAAIPGMVGDATNPGTPTPDATHPERTLASLFTVATNLSYPKWPAPYKDAPVTTANSLADYALYYWMTDLRGPPATGLTNDVPSADGRAGKDLDWKRDPAWWQHVSFSALSYGSDGILDSTDVTAKTDQIANQAVPYPWFSGGNYPAPPNQPVPKRAAAIDDLWHATVNSRGTFVYAETPIEVAYGLGKIISGIGNNQKARVGAAFVGQQLHVNTGLPGDLVATNDFIYQATIEPGWAGDIKKVRVDTVTGVELLYAPFGPNPLWSAAAKLDALLATPAAGTSPLVESDNAWFLNRRIVTKNTTSGAIVPFLHANLSAAQQATLGSSATQQQKAVAYLRGGSTFGAGPNPPLIEGVRIGQLRQRGSKLGSISDAKPVIVGPPIYDFSDTNDVGYTAYKAANTCAAPPSSTCAPARPLRIFAGANDGMFHVFNGMDDTGPNTGGTEVFAYIPSSLFNNNVDEGGKPKGIRALTFQDGGAPIFKHHFYVNTSPRMMDVDFANCGSNAACAPDWRTIVVGGLGKGGATYFAIDATNPTVATEAQAAAKVLWEFTLPGGQFSYGRPIIAKTRADGWVVVIASGYNNTDGTVYGNGKGFLHFLRVTDGTKIRTLSTTGADTGSIANPSGLAQINGFTKDVRNQIIEQIYGGDLNGNVWRWDVSDPNPAVWAGKTTLFAVLRDPSNVVQPVTIAPQIEIDINNGTDRFVFIGTGQLLDPIDLTVPSPEQIQTMYAIRDGTLELPSTTGLPIAPRATLAAAAGVVGVGAIAPNGWYNDLPLGQRIVNDPQADLNLVAFAGTAVQPDPCLTSLPAYIYARDFTTGESLIFTGGVVAPSFYSTEGAVGLELVALDKAGSSFPTLAIVFTKETNASIKPVEVKPKSFGGGHRLSWRILGE